jgi:putative oxidoreductase
MDIALLGLRLVVGLGFAAHGAQKLFGWFGGYGISGTGGYFESLGMRPGKVHATAAGAAELLGGLAIALGLVTPVAAAALIAVMTVAIVMVHLKNGWFNSNNGYELNVLLIAAVFALAGIGAGDWSLDNALNIDLTGTGWALGALAAGILGGLGALVTRHLPSPRRHDAGAGQTSAA